jgi:hypothetical protein
MTIPTSVLDQFLGLLANEQNQLTNQLSSNVSDDEAKRKAITDVKEVNQILCMLYKYKENQLPKVEKASKSKK